MAVYTIGTGTLTQGKSVGWFWNFNGPPRVPFTAQAVPSNEFANLVDLRIHDLGVESTFGNTGAQGIFYNHRAVVSAWSGNGNFSFVIGDFL
jgi:hypothetical protein